MIASNLASCALQDTNKRIVQTLEVNSEVLDNIHEEFVKIVIESGLKIHSFQEGRGLSGVKGFSGKVSLTNEIPSALLPANQLATGC